MNIEFILIQLLGFMAWGFLVLSYYRKNTDKILVFQIIGTLLYCIHYFLLGGYSGLFICAFETIFDYGYYKTDKDDYIYIFSVPIRILGGLLTFRGFMDLLPIIASLTDGYTLTKQKKIVVVGAIISYTLWVIYDIYIMSISGAITDGIIVLSNLSIILFNYNILKKDDNEVVNLRVRK